MPSSTFHDLTDIVSTGEILMKPSFHFGQLFKGIQLFPSKTKMQTKNLNNCGSCSSWRFNSEKSKDKNLNTSSLVGKVGLCVGRRDDGLQTQYDDFCSMWESVF